MCVWLWLADAEEEAQPARICLLHKYRAHVKSSEPQNLLAAHSFDCSIYIRIQI